MFSVFIVDDEVVVREALRNKIDWEGSGFVLAGEAGDGEIALSMMQDIKPDILITDIKMPFMDGLELSRMLKKLQPWIRIIILSGHDEFDYAKKAISIGVEDYILKPFTSEDLLAGLKKIEVELDREKAQFSDMARMKAELESSSAIVKEKFLTDIVLGTVSGADAMQRAGEFNIDLISRYYVVSVSWIKSARDDINDLTAAKSRLMSFADGGTNLIGFLISPDRFICIIKGQNAESLEDDCYNAAAAIEHELGKGGDCLVVTAIGSVVDRAAYISNSYREAESILGAYRFSDRNCIIGIEDFKKTEASAFTLPESDPLVDRLRYAGDGEIDETVSHYMAILRENPEHFSIIASYLMVDVIMAVAKLIEELGGDMKKLNPEILTRGFVDKAVQNSESFEREAKRIFVFALEYRNSKIQGKYGDVILRAKKYIDDNFANQDICLRSVADAVHFSPNHFSTVFSQECGITFIEYLTDIRINEAKKLLKNTDKKGNDISYECGFSDPHYFSYIFKKTTGLSPREFRTGG